MMGNVEHYIGEVNCHGPHLVVTMIAYHNKQQRYIIVHFSEKTTNE